MLIIHIITVLIGVVASVITLLRPSRQLVVSLYISTGAVFISGAWLTIFSARPIGVSCVLGAVYLVAVAFIVKRAYRQLLPAKRSV